MNKLNTPSKLTIIEGFEMVGKSTFALKCIENPLIYHPDHVLTDATIGRSQSWVIGQSIIDFLSCGLLDSLESTGTNVVIDRGICSSFVYGILHSHELIDSKVIDWYKNNKFFKDKVSILYFHHECKESARKLFEESKKRKKNPNKLSAAYDEFSDFENYWRMYCRADALFRESFEILGVRPQFIRTNYGGYIDIGQNTYYL